MVHHDGRMHADCSRALVSSFMNGVFHPKKIKYSLGKLAPTSNPTLLLPWCYLCAMVGRIVVLPPETAVHGVVCSTQHIENGMAIQSQTQHNPC